MAAPPAERHRRDHHAPLHPRGASHHHGLATEAVECVEGGLLGDHSEIIDEEAIAEAPDEVEGNTGWKRIGGEVDRASCLPVPRMRTTPGVESASSAKTSSRLNEHFRACSRRAGARAMYGSPPAATYPPRPRANSVAEQVQAEGAAVARPEHELPVCPRADDVNDHGHAQRGAPEIRRRRGRPCESEYRGDQQDAAGCPKGRPSMTATIPTAPLRPRTRSRNL